MKTVDRHPIPPRNEPRSADGRRPGHLASPARPLAALAASAALLAGATGPAHAEQVRLDVAMAQPVMLADQKAVTHLKVGLTGFEAKLAGKRTPVNVALVLDKSGSMSGEKIRQAKRAAAAAVERLGPDDVIALVVYDNNASVLLPATKVGDKRTVWRAIDRIEAGGSTALHAGVQCGAAEVRKFFAKGRVNRIILLSDGIANVGPSSPAALGELGASLIREGISVTTLGLGTGYNEDLMSQLAMKSDGNHTFIESPDQVAAVFDAEFGDVLSVVAQEVVIKVRCQPGIRPVRVLGREADIAGQEVVATVNQIYAAQEKYVLLEVEVPPTGAGAVREVATVEVSYANMATQTTDRLTSSVAVRFSPSEKAVAEHAARDVNIATVLQIATEANCRATALRDAGKVEEARSLLAENGKYLRANSTLWGSKELEQYAGENDKDARGLDGSAWNSTRKRMRRYQFQNSIQQSY